MSIQQFCLRWNNHQPNFISVFTTLLNTESLVDVTLAAEGRHLQAHKVVLSACSVYFQTLFTENPSRHPIVILKDVKYSDLRIMVDFMYYGEVNVSQEQLPQILETAKMLKIKGLTEMPESTSLTRAQGADPFLQPEPERQSASPHAHSDNNANKRRKRRPSTGNQHSSCSTSTHEDSRQEATPPSVELSRDSITLSSLPRRRAHDYHDDRTADAGQQTDETAQNMHNDDPLLMETNPPGLSQGGQWSMMEHGYPRYSNACLAGAGLQGDGMGGYISNVMSHVNMVDMAEYNPGGGNLAAHASPCGGDAAQHEHAALQAGGGGGGAGGVGGAGGGSAGGALLAAPAKRRRTANPQSEENFQRALEAVRFGGIGFCKAARMFGVNNRTLWLEYKKKGYPNNRPSIKSRIKREHTTPPPDHKEEAHEAQPVLLCPPHPAVPVVGFIDSRPVDFPLQGMPHASPLNLHSLNFNTMQ